MILSTCPAGKHGASTPLVKHPCGVAAEALDDAALPYDVRTVGGFKHVPFSRRGRRDDIVALTGQEDVPVLVLDDGTTVQGSADIVRWAPQAIVRDARRRQARRRYPRSTSSIR